MKWMDEFRDRELVVSLLGRIDAACMGRRYRLMEFCGGHTHALYRYGLIEALPEAVEMVHGPGCPVCVLPAGRIDMAIDLVRNRDVVLCTYGDMLRVPGGRGESLLSARAAGGEVRMVYSPLDAVAMAERLPDREIVFFAVGFETTAPATALALHRAKSLGLTNFTVFCNHVLTVPAMRAIADDEQGAAIDGVIGPGHVTAVVGFEAFDPIAVDYRLPVAIAGFEPADLLSAILMLLRQINAGKARVENAYTRAVTAKGNEQAAALMRQVFALRQRFAWRGLGVLEASALRVADEYAGFDAEQRFGMQEIELADHRACRCAEVLRGHMQPHECPVFATACTPEHPLGACMVSSEGACAAAFRYERPVVKEQSAEAEA